MILAQIEQSTSLFKWLTENVGFGSAVLFALVAAGIYAMYKSAKWVAGLVEKYIEEKREQHKELKDEFKSFADSARNLFSKVDNNESNIAEVRDEVKENRSEISKTTKNLDRVVEGLRHVKDTLEKEIPKISDISTQAVTANAKADQALKEINEIKNAK